MRLEGLAAAAAALLMTLPGGAQSAQPAQLTATLAKLDAASAHFSSAQATFHKDLYNALVKDTTPQDGSIYFVRQKNGTTQMGARIDGAGARVVEYKGGTLRDYNPAIQCYDTVNAAQNRSRVESFLTLGFGGSGRELAKAWEIADLGTETMAGTKVEKLDLKPREDSVKGLVMHVTLWLDLERGVSLKQVFYSPSGDTQTAIYAKIRLNEKVDMKPFEIKGNTCGK